MYRSTSSKLRLVNPAYTIKFPPATNCADGTCFSTIEPLSFTDTEHWLYHLREPRQITTRCRSAKGWETHTQTISDAGAIKNAAKCLITANEFQTLPEIRWEIQSTIVNTHFYVPDQIQIVADHEIPLINKYHQKKLRDLMK